jgi:hypothetical protein
VGRWQTVPEKPSAETSGGSMARKSCCGPYGKTYEKSKFDRFLREYGVEELARRLGFVGSSAIWHWIDGSASPHPSNMIKVLELAKERKLELTIEDILQHFREVGHKRYRPRSLKLKPKPKLARA